MAQPLLDRGLDHKVVLKHLEVVSDVGVDDQLLDRAAPALEDTEINLAELAVPKLLAKVQFCAERFTTARESTDGRMNANDVCYTLGGRWKAG